jgi:outer membrane protein assembly factor BamB
VELKSAISLLENNMKDVNGMTRESDSTKGRSGPLGISGGTWRLLIIPVLLCMVLPLGVNAFMFRNDTTHAGIYDGGVTKPNNVPLWNYSFGGFAYLNPDEYTYVMDNSTYASPVVVGGVVYEGSLGGKLRALDATTGAVLHTFTDTPPVGERADDLHASPAVRDGVVYFTSYDHYLYALHTTDFSNHFAPRDIGAPGHSSPAVTADAVYVGSDNGVVYKFDTATGTQQWANKTNATVTGATAMHSSPAVVDNVVYIGNEDGTLYALNADTGMEIWHFTTSGGAIKSSPAVVGGVVYFGNNDGNFYAISTTTHTNVGWSPYAG